MPNDALQACPFCGGEAALGTTTIRRWKDVKGNYGTFTGHAVNCVMCGATNRGIAEGFKTPEEAVAQWNHRALRPTPPTTKPVAWFRVEDGLRVYYETEAWPNMTPLYEAPLSETPAQQGHVNSHGHDSRYGKQDEAPTVAEIEEFRKEHHIPPQPDDEPWIAQHNRVLNYLCYRACTPVSAIGALKDDVPLKCEVVDGAIQFVIGAKVLAHATNICPGLYDAEADRGRYRVTDPAAFAVEVAHVLNEEREDGSTRLTDMMDEAVEHAIDWGAEGVEENSAPSDSTSAGKGEA